VEPGEGWGVLALIVIGIVLVALLPAKQAPERQTAGARSAV